VATDRLELFILCRQSKIQSRGMMQYQQKGHFVRKKAVLLMVQRLCVTAAMPNSIWFDSHLADLRFVFFLCFFSGFA